MIIKTYPRKSKFSAWAPTARLRAIALKAMGFESYQEYLESDLWKGIRRKQLDKHPTCCVCDGPAVLVHHMNYAPETLKAWNSHSFASMCVQCHKDIHTTADGKVQSLRRSNNRIQFLREQRSATEKAKARLRKDRAKQAKKKGELFVSQLPTSRSKGSRLPVPNPA